MITFFCCKENVKLNYSMDKYNLSSEFKGVPSVQEVNGEDIYFCDPVFYQQQLEIYANQFGRTAKDVFVSIDMNSICSLKEYPKDIAYGNFEENFREFKGKSEVKIGIIHAFTPSSLPGIGDSFIAMQAFSYWCAKIHAFLPGTKVSVSLFQLNPLKVKEVFKHDDIKNTYVMPSNLMLLLNQDVFIDFGPLNMGDKNEAKRIQNWNIQREYQTLNMFDFYLKAFSINPEEVNPIHKRAIYSFKEIKMIDIPTERPVLLFHHKASDAIRSLEEDRAISIINEIIKKSDYFVVSAQSLDFKNERFLDISAQSTSLDDLATIISQVDAIVTVDTCVYHLADAFDVPTVVLFSTIDPEIRIKYYPFVKGIMYEDKQGKIFGKHAVSADPREAEKELEYLKTVWDKIDVDEILDKLK